MDETEIKKSICGICSAGCGIDAYIKNGRLVKVQGSKENPANKGALCAKGRMNPQYVHHQDRITAPLLKTKSNSHHHFIPISWDEALDRIVDRLLRIKTDFGPESVVFFTGYPKWLRPFLKRLAHGFGSPNYCSESSTCFFATIMASH